MKLKRILSLVAVGCMLFGNTLTSMAATELNCTYTPYENPAGKFDFVMTVSTDKPQADTCISFQGVPSGYQCTIMPWQGFPIENGKVVSFSQFDDSKEVEEVVNSGVDFHIGTSFPGPEYIYWWPAKDGSNNFEFTVSTYDSPITINSIKSVDTTPVQPEVEVVQSNPVPTEPEINTEQPVVVEPVQQQPVVTEGEVVYTVGKDANLSCIALNYYGKASLASSIYQYNKEILKQTGGKLVEGMGLKLPATLGKTTRIGLPVANAGETLYVVKEGENLKKIAKNVYGDSNLYKAVFERNKDRIKDASTIYSGQIIVLPAK